MELFQLYLSPVDAMLFKAIVTQSPVGEGETESSLPFFEGVTDWRTTLIKTLETAAFNPEDFRKSGEQGWMVKSGMLTSDQNAFHPNLLKNIGKLLYQSLFPPGSKVEKVLQASLRLAEDKGAKLHIQLKFEADVVQRSRLADYPWELLHDGQRFLGHHQVTLSRYIAHDTVPPNLPPFKQVKVLLVSSAAVALDQGLKRLSKQEQQAVRKGLENAKQTKQIHLDELEYATLNHLRDYLTGHQGPLAPHVLHFDGHGLFGKRCLNQQCRAIHRGIKAERCRVCHIELPQPQGYLVFEDEDGRPDYVSAVELGTLLRQSSVGDGSNQSGGIALVVLSACQSGMAVAGDSVFNGTAQNLISHRVPAVVAMQYSVSVDSATKFAEQFYRSLGQKNSLAIAVSQGREAMGAEGNQWYRPVLYLRWRDNEGGQLFALPDHNEDWSNLLAQTRDNLNVIPDKIGNTVFLPRTKTLNELEGAFSKNRVVVLLGPSGCGKTVIAKSWAEKELNSKRVLWWNAKSFDVLDFQTFQGRLELTNPLREILSTNSDSQAYVIVDGLDRMFSEAAFQNLAVLIHILRLGNKASPWRVLIPCQLEEWNRVQIQLVKANVSTDNWQIIQVNEPSADDLAPVWNAFPALRPLRLQLHLQSLLLKPKVLDLLTTKLSNRGFVDTTKWVGESNLIEWFWETEVSNQSNAMVRAAFLKALGERQADNLESETPTDTFSSTPYLQVLDDLINNRLCQEREERLSFYHDLYGDWARQRVLLGKTNNLQEYIKYRVSSPLWHRPVRLFGLHLLEKNEDATHWRSALVSLYGDDNAPDLTSDLLLEAVIFAANPLPLLERIWADLAANDGLLLRRFLVRFLYIATLPNPVIQAIASQLGSDLETTAATMQRIPYWPYWLPMLRFLHGHLANVTDLAPKQIAEIADTWLRRGSKNLPLRQEAAELALATAEKLFRSRQASSFPYNEEKLCETIYHAALAGAYEIPARVANFALEASSRRETITQAHETDTQSEPVIKRVIHDPVYGTYELELAESSWSLIDDPERNIDPIMFRNFSSEFGDEEGEEPLAWPDGPLRKVDSAFRKTCLTTDALLPLITVNPNVAREVLLALLIEEPSVHHRKLGISSEPVWYPPFYTQGPLLFFIKHQPTEGLELILRFVNFATERWADIWRRENQPIPDVSITLSGSEHQWLGDKQVYYWYYNYNSCPHPVTVALMVLEKWLYNEIDEKKPVDNVIELILQRSISVAFAGLLSALARKSPFLFQGPLRLLLTVPEFYLWESQHRLSSVSAMTITITWLGQSEQIIKLVRDWYELPHRKQGLHKWAQYFFINIPEMRTLFEGFRLQWLKRLQLNSEEDGLKLFLEKLVDEYNIENYRIQNHPRQGDFWIFESPNEADRKEKALREDSERRLLLLSFPLRCREILNAGQPLLDEQLEQFWNSLQNIAGFSSVENEFGLYDIENSICGGIAVLLQFHWNWLQQYPEREEWCVEQLIKIISEPPAANKFGNEESNSEWEWDIFCAQIIPLIWSRFPDSNTWRECVALLVTSSRYAVVSTVFAYAAKFRSSFYEEFKRLQHFLFRWAAVRWKWDRTRYGLESTFDIEVERHREIKAFLEKSISPNLPSWKEVAIQVWEELADKKPHEKYSQPSLFGPSTPSQFPSLDFRLICSAYAWLPALEQAISRTERTEWIMFWREALNYLLQIPAENRTLTGWSRWLSRHIAFLILGLQPAEKPENFWKPILSLEMQKDHWIEDFLTQWFTSGLSSEPVCDIFIQECYAMVEFAFSSPNWKFDPRLRQYGLEELWCYLVGLNSSISEMWTINQKPVIKQMYAIYQRWAKEHLNKPRCALPFVAFLLQPAAEELRIDSLLWLYEASQTNEQFWSERNIQEKLASLLDVCWRSHQSKLRQHCNSLNAFKHLLKKLADFQNVLALEIQQRIAFIQ